MWANFWFVIFPYICVAIFVVGHIWRYRHDQFGWTTRTSQVLESRWLSWGSPLFHFGALFVIAGHVGGLLIPREWTRALGVNDHMYHNLSMYIGTAAGVALVAGTIILIIRRFITSQRIRVVTTAWDYALYALLVIEIFVGMWQKISTNIVGEGYDYRGTVSVWFRQLFILQPDAALIMDAPTIYAIHAILGCLLIAIWPFTRLVHVWSIPVAYLARPYVVYRRKHTPDVSPLTKSMRK